MAAGFALLAGTVTPVSADTGNRPGAKTEQGAAPAESHGGTVRLVTGDRVTVTVSADGRTTASATATKT